MFETWDVLIAMFFNSDKKQQKQGGFSYKFPNFGVKKIITSKFIT